MSPNFVGKNFDFCKLTIKKIDREASGDTYHIFSVVLLIPTVWVATKIFHEISSTTLEFPLPLVEHFFQVSIHELELKIEKIYSLLERCSAEIINLKYVEIRST